LFGLAKSDTSPAGEGGTIQTSIIEEITRNGWDICVPALHRNDLLAKKPEPNIVTNVWLLSGPNEGEILRALKGSTYSKAIPTVFQSCIFTLTERS
jgi:hypothetical protein